MDNNRCDVCVKTIAGEAIADISSIDVKQLTGSELKNIIAETTGFPIAGMRLFSGCTLIPNDIPLQRSLTSDNDDIGQFSLTCIIMPSEPFGPKRRLQEDPLVRTRNQNAVVAYVGDAYVGLINKLRRFQIDGKDPIRLSRPTTLSLRKQIEELLKMSCARHLASLVELGLQAAYQSCTDVAIANNDPCDKHYVNSGDMFGSDAAYPASRDRALADVSLVDGNRCISVDLLGLNESPLDSKDESIAKDVLLDNQQRPCANLLSWEAARQVCCDDAVICAPLVDNHLGSLNLDFHDERYDVRANLQGLNAPSRVTTNSVLFPTPCRAYLYEDRRLEAYANVSGFQLCSQVTSPDLTQSAMLDLFGFEGNPCVVSAALWRVLPCWEMIPGGDHGNIVKDGPIFEIAFFAVLSAPEVVEEFLADSLLEELETLANRFRCTGIAVAPIDMWTGCGGSERHFWREKHGYDVVAPSKQQKTGASQEIARFEERNGADTELEEPCTAFGRFLLQHMLVFTDVPILAKAL